MFLPLIIHDYFLWHYGRAWWEIWGVWRNYIWFVVHLFSIPQLLRSWFAPFKRISEGRGDTWNLEDLASFVIVNIMSRFVGFVARTAIILVGVITLLVTLAVGFVIYTLWMMLPVLIVVLLGASLSLFFITI